MYPFTCLHLAELKEFAKLKSRNLGVIGLAQLDIIYSRVTLLGCRCNSPRHIISYIKCLSADIVPISLLPYRGSHNGLKNPYTYIYMFHILPVGTT